MGPECSSLLLLLLLLTGLLIAPSTYVVR